MQTGTGVSLPCDEFPAPTALPGTAIHLIGICGSGMRALAELLTDLGARVSGSDLAALPHEIARFHDKGIQVWAGHSAERISRETRVVVHSPAVRPADPERSEARRRGILNLSYPQTVARLMRGHTTISIAGTHGKSTTTAMTAWILKHAGRKPSVVIGAEVLELERSGWAGQGHLFVVESCEYQRHFLEYSPQCAAILSTEPDHFDSFGSLAENEDAFRVFASRLPSNGCLIVPCESQGVTDWSEVTRAPVQTFGFLASADWSARELRATPAGWQFEMWRGSEPWIPTGLRIPGRHNVSNAIAAAALAHWGGADRESIAAGLLSFPGIRRRFERLGRWNEIDLVDDYAHHPTAIRATIACAKEHYPGRRLVVAFQPHQISRTTALLEDFSNAFAQADDVLITPVFVARETCRDDAKLTLSRELAGRIRATGTPCRFIPSLDHLGRTLDDSLQPGDVLLTMGAGNIGQIQNEFLRRLS